MRALLAQLRSPLLSDGDLVTALQQHCGLLAQQTGLQVQLQAPEPLVLPAELANELFLIAREALHNVVKHSRVQKALCQLSLEEGQIILVVQDQGEGFDLAEVSAAGGDGLGLQSMQDRARALGGHMEINTAPGQGTRLEIRVPVPAATEA